MAEISKNLNPFTPNFGQELIASRKSLYLINLFYTIVDPRLFQLYMLYLRPSLEAYDGIIPGFHDFSVGRVPQGLMPAIAQGTKQMIFKQPVSYSVEDEASYNYFRDWGERACIDDLLSQAYINSCAGGTALIQLNMDGNGDYWLNTFRIDKFQVDTNNKKEVVRSVAYIDSFKSVIQRNIHYSLVEERYYNARGKAVRVFNYYQSSSLVNINRPPKPENMQPIDWSALPENLQEQHKKLYGSIIVGKEQLLPFGNELGVVIIKFEDSIPGYENLPLGRPLADILLYDSCQYDMNEQWGVLEGYVSLPRILIPTPYRQTDQNGTMNHSLDGFVYHKYEYAGDGSDKKPESMQFEARFDKKKIWRDMILESAAFKLNLSATMVASFLNDTNRATATAIIASKDKSDMFIADKVGNITNPMNRLLRIIATSQGLQPPKLEIHSQSILDPKTRFETYSPLLEKGHISPELYVKVNHPELDRKSATELVDYIKANMATDKAEVEAQEETIVDAPEEEIINAGN